MIVSRRGIKKVWFRICVDRCLEEGWGREECEEVCEAEVYGLR